MQLLPNEMQDLLLDSATDMHLKTPPQQRTSSSQVSGQRTIGHRLAQESCSRGAALKIFSPIQLMLKNPTATRQSPLNARSRHRVRSQGKPAVGLDVLSDLTEGSLSKSHSVSETKRHEEGQVRPTPLLQTLDTRFGCYHQGAWGRRFAR